MDAKLTRKSASLYGILGEWSRLSDGQKLFVTLEHAYVEEGKFVPKLAAGTYRCIRRFSPKHGEIFMVENPPAFEGHPVTYIEIHVGNYNSDSEGCILLGETLGVGCILESRPAVDSFMEMQLGTDAFTLVVC